jgi:predicted ATP-grasp superfamily ATP-dependent carboligase
LTRSALVLDGRSGPALAVTRSLGRAGWRVFAGAGTRSAFSRYADDAYPLPEATDDPHAFVEAVGAAIVDAEVDLVVPCTDASAELLWANESILRGARVLGGDRNSFELASDKARTLTAAEEAGFPVPSWVAPEDVSRARAACAEIGLPCVVKPRRSYTAEGVGLRHRRHVFVRRLDDLESALHSQAEPDGRLPIVQEYVPGRSLAVSAVVRQGEVIALVARETLSFDPIEGGTSVWKRTIPPDDVGVEAALDLLRKVRFEGLGEVEYQVDAHGVPRLMEIGARAHGWLALAIAAGVDLPYIAAMSLVGEDVHRQSRYKVGLEMRWPAGEIARLRRVLDPRAQLPPTVRRRDVIARAWPPWRPGMLYDGLIFGDPGPWLPSRLRSRVRRARGAR